MEKWQCHSIIHDIIQCYLNLLLLLLLLCKKVLSFFDFYRLEILKVMFLQQSDYASPLLMRYKIWSMDNGEELSLYGSAPNSTETSQVE